MKKILSALLFSIFFFVNAKAQDFTQSLKDIPPTSQRGLFSFDETTNQLLGINAYDPEKNILPSKTQSGTFGLLNPTKVNFAGIFNRYGTEGEDHGDDWNFMIEPFPDYKYIYILATKSSYQDSSKWPGIINRDRFSSCHESDYNGKPGVMAEIAPYSELYKNNIWFKPTENHCQEGEYLKSGDAIAVYGCPVNDNNHGYNPEIHPAQQIWFRNKSKTTESNQSYWLFFIQDASQRFGDWVNSPICGQFRIAFKVNPNTTIGKDFQPLSMNITVEKKYDLVTNKFPAYAEDSDDGNSHSLVIDGKKLLTVNEPSETDDLLGIQFVFISKHSDGIVQGYVQISMALGDYATDEIGACVLGLNVVKGSSGIIK